MTRYIDLFSGAGGLSLGLDQAGCVPELAVEIDHAAVETYRRNFDGVSVYAGDIREKSFKKMKGSIELVAGGPPCQPFSVAGWQRSHNDPRDMIPEFIRVVREAHPSAFIMENVAGLYSRRHQEYLGKAISALASLGFEVHAKVFSAADYGVPQDRKRLFIVGTLEPGYSFPAATHGSGQSQPHVASAQALKDAPADTPNSAKVTYAKVPVLRPSPYAGMLVNGGGRPINLERPSPTIPASAGGNRTHIVDEEGILLAYHAELMEGGAVRSGIVEGVRRLTVRESARLQTFPDAFTFSGPRSACYRQIGNAVPPKLARAIATSVNNFISR